MLPRHSYVAARAFLKPRRVPIQSTGLRSCRMAVEEFVDFEILHDSESPGSIFSAIIVENAVTSLGARCIGLDDSYSKEAV